MIRRYDIVHAVILICLLAIANFIGNSVIKGILLLLFSAVLIVNTIMNLHAKKEAKLTDKLFFGILFFLDIVLAIGAVVVITTAIL